MQRMMELKLGQTNEVFYKNHRGEEGVRRIQPTELWYGTEPHHQNEGPQWYVHAWCYDRKAYRNFALKDMKATDAEDGSVTGLPPPSRR